ncbi:MAG: hypothetical protein ACREL5_05450 [Gemmatimonadales bacterium]
MTRGHGDRPPLEKPWRRRLILALTIVVAVILVIEIVSLLLARL